MRFSNVLGVAKMGKTGDSIQMAWKAGAAAEGLEVQASYRPGPVDLSTTSHLAPSARQPHLWLNPKGERICDESMLVQWSFAGNALERQGGTM